MKFIRRHFLIGLIVLAPTVVTGYLTWWVFVRVDNIIAPLKVRYPVIDIPGLGFAVILLSVLIVGIVANNLIGRRIISWGERVVNSLPIIRRVYMAVKEISEVFLSDRKTAFQSVVLVRYPHKDAYALAFVTKDGIPYFNELTDEALINVFLPTTPNPTSGFMLMLPKREVLRVDISVEEAMKIVISGGAFSPQLLEELRRERVT